MFRVLMDLRDWGPGNRWRSVDYGCFGVIYSRGIKGSRQIGEGDQSNLGKVLVRTIQRIGLRGIRFRGSQFKESDDGVAWILIWIFFIMRSHESSGFGVVWFIMTQGQLLGTGGAMKEGENTRKRLKISVPHFDNSALIKIYAKTLIGRCMNPAEQEMQALLQNIPMIWKFEDRVVGTDLGHGKFQFDFQTKEEIEDVLKLQQYHFDYWMLALARWQPRKSQLFPSEIPFWVRVRGVPTEFRTLPTFESVGGALGRLVSVDLELSRVQVVVDGFQQLCLETTVEFKGGEFYDLSTVRETFWILSNLC
ncbi:PREDICTED: uncharacterized protein LOC106327376 isoform X1 [Brassica oleracea var. oleracea]|uniref:uncharacterized protein LOC106327376 isoform X1 n=1 Tax=Brassica oleracea var. oleracea TaxID=109376 RepID=UPI0006A71B37|nr:PREDICTED: uncharacterized protein LOC106327376 isoform X1 [Brassica oleracea var. oleracea]